MDTPITTATTFFTTNTTTTTTTTTSYTIKVMGNLRFHAQSAFLRPFENLLGVHTILLNHHY